MRFFFSFLLLLICAALAAQSAPCDYAKLMQQGRDSLQAKKYQGALKKFNAARTCDRDKSPEVDKAVNAVFRAIEGEKEEALRQKKRAEEARQQMENALKEAKEARLRSDSLYELADTERRRAEAALDKIYFYNNRFGLTYDKIKRQYGFIDKQLNTKIGFRYREALPFDDIGYAKVKKDDNNYYLIDTTGAEFLLATDINQLTPSVSALDLSNKNFSQIPNAVFSQTQLKILLLSSNQLDSLPKKICKLTNLETLYLLSNKLTNLPPEIGQLKSLKSLDLSRNRISTLPPEIGQLENLRSLNLRLNNLQTLPTEIGQLKHLQSLDISSSQRILSPPDEPPDFDADEKDLVENRLKTLPSEIQNLKSLNHLNLRYNPFSRAYIEQLRNDMPWCEIVFSQKRFRKFID